MDVSRTDVKHLLGLFYSQIKEIATDQASSLLENLINDPKDSQSFAKKSISLPEKFEDNNIYSIIEESLIAGKNEISDQVLAGYIAMLKDQIKKDPMDIDKQIIILKLSKLLMFNAAFSLKNKEADTKYLYIHFVSSFVDYLKHVLAQCQNKSENTQDILKLQNVITHCFSCTKNYTFQLNNVLKMEKHPFDNDEITFINKVLEGYIIDDKSSIIEGNSKPLMNQKDVKMDVSQNIPNSEISQVSSSAELSPLEHLTNLLCLMVCEQYCQEKVTKIDIEEEKVSTEAPIIELTNSLPSFDSNSKLTKLLFDDNPSTSSLLKDSVIDLLGKLTAEHKNDPKSLALITGTRMKKLRWVLQKLDDAEAIEQFDAAFKNLIMELLAKAHEQKEADVKNLDLKSYITHSLLVQKILKEWHLYSNWNPYASEANDRIPQFYELWKELSSKELNELPKFFDLTIRWIQSCSGNISDKERDEHLNSLMKLYTFLMPEQKKSIIVNFIQDVYNKFVYFASNASKLNKDDLNIFIMQLSLLDMILEHTIGVTAQTISPVKDMLLNSFKQNESQTNQKDVEMISDNSNTNEKIENMRERFDSILGQQLEISELSAQSSLFLNIYELMQQQIVTLSYALLSSTDLLYNEAIKSSDLVMHLSNITKFHEGIDFYLKTVQNNFDEIKDKDLQTLLMNLDSGNDATYEDIHNNAYKEMILIVLENKVIQEHNKLNQPSK